MKEILRRQTDILILGSGGAGLFAALHANLHRRAQRQSGRHVVTDAPSDITCFLGQFARLKAHMHAFACISGAQE